MVLSVTNVFGSLLFNTLTPHGACRVVVEWFLKLLSLVPQEIPRFKKNRNFAHDNIAEVFTFTGHDSMMIVRLMMRY